MGKEEQIQVCCVCGDIGFSDLLIYCSECYDFSIHRYCLGIIPGSEDDTDLFYWVCESCCPSMETNPYEIVLVEDQPEPLQILLPKSFPGILEEETSSQCQHTGETPSIAFISMADCDEELLSSPFIECPEAIAEGLILIVSSSGGITIHESWNILSLTSSPNEISLDTLVKQPDPFVIEPDCARAGDEVHNNSENEQGYTIENTVELDFGAEEQINSKTVELDLGTDEENDVCYPGEPPTIHEIKKRKHTFSDCVVGSSEENMEDTVHQRIEASEIEVPEQTLQPGLSDNESQSSISPEMSIPASVLDMANELLESTLEKIDVQVGPYKISSDLAPILRNVLNKYGDIFHDCVVEPNTFLVTVCQTIRHLQSTPFKSLRQKHVDFVRDALKVPEAFGVDVKWLNRHCDYLEKIVRQTVQYLALKQERSQTVRSFQLKKEMVGLKGVNPNEPKEELRMLKAELSFKEDRMKKLEHGMESLKSLWRKISTKSLADGLF